MKKFGKILALAVSLLLLMSLTSCLQLEDVKAMRGWYSEDKQSIEWKGRTFVKSSLDISSVDFSMDYDPVFVSTRELPLLMTGKCQQYLSDVEERILLISYDPTGYEGPVASPDSIKPALYIREDVKEEVEETVKSRKMDHFCVDAYNADTFEPARKLLSDDLTKKLKAVLSDSSLIIDEKTQDAYDYCDHIAVSSCDKSMLVREMNVCVYWALNKNDDNENVTMVEYTEEGSGEYTYYLLQDLSLYRELQAFIFPDGE